MTYDPLPDEEFLIGRFSEDVGIRVKVPSDPSERRDLLRSLMNVRPPADTPKDVLDVQDRLLSYRRKERGTTRAEDLEFRNGICLWRGDITTLECDAIVNAANSGMLGCFVPCHRCIDNAIHTFAGVQLRSECASMMKGTKEPVGSARITGAYNLPCRYVIHTVGPMVTGPLRESDRDALRSCYRSCLELAYDRGLRTIAFCCISTGEFRFPNREAAEIAVDEVKTFLAEHNGLEVIFDVFTDRDSRIYEGLL